MTAYYNENNKFAAAWLRNLIAAGLIAPGDVDERSIVDVQPEELKNYQQCHFFAGIGGWSYALRITGWNDECPVWTGSCPCQPFSTAGKKQATADNRHLWPEFYRLISQCNPAIVFGEQVASKLGYAWMDEVRLDLETSRYAVGIACLPAICVGAPHLRERLYWVANSEGKMRCRRAEMASGEGEKFGGSSAHILQEAWPDGFGDGSTLSFSDVCAPSYGVPARVGRLRGYGNAIIPQIAAKFILSVREVIQ